MTRLRMRARHTWGGSLLALAVLALLVSAACAGEASPAVEDASGGADGPAPAASPADNAGTEGASTAEFDFPTGPPVLVAQDYEPPEDHVPSTGAYLPANGKPTLVFVDAIWCPTCALTRPIFHDVRVDYQDAVNIVVLDYDRDEDARLADRLGVRAHPAWAVVAPDSDEVVERRFGPLHERALREFLDEVMRRFAAEGSPGA